MTENDNIEKLFREKLGAYTEAPPAVVWDKIAGAISPVAPVKPWYLKKAALYYAAAFLGLVSVLTIYFAPQFHSNEPKLLSVQKDLPAIKTQKTESIRPRPVSPAINQPESSLQKKNLNNKQQSVAEPIITSEKSDITIGQNITALPEEKKVLNHEANTDLAAFVSKPELMPAELIKTEPLKNTKSDNTQIITEKTQKVEEQNAIQQTPSKPIAVSLPDTNISLLPQAALPQPVNRNAAPYSLSFTTGYDKLFNTSTKLTHSYNSDLRLSWQRNDFMIQTGFGIDYSNDQWNYSYDFRQKEVVGSYTKVDSISFIQSMDSLGNIIYLPRYFTSSQNVYDSINRHTSHFARDYYTYIHFPVLMAYRVFSFRRLDVHMKLGPVFSILISKTQNTPDNALADSRLILSKNNRISRLSTNYYMVAACDIKYSISSNIALTLEPTLRYFKDPFYEAGPSSDNPWSAGFRFGLTYNLNRN